MLPVPVEPDRACPAVPEPTAPVRLDDVLTRPPFAPTVEPDPIAPLPPRLTPMLDALSSANAGKPLTLNALPLSRFRIFSSRLLTQTSLCFWPLIIIGTASALGFFFISVHPARWL
jgi:hypothetical protein